MQPDTLRAIDAYLQHGGKVIAVISKPSMSPGMKNAAKVSAEIKGLSDKLFEEPGATFVATEDRLGKALLLSIPADMVSSSDAGDVGFIHRKTNDADIYFVANTSNHRVKTTLHFLVASKFAAEWNPLSGDERVSGVAPAIELAPTNRRCLSSVIPLEEVLRKGQV